MANPLLRGAERYAEALAKEYNWLLQDMLVNMASKVWARSGNSFVGLVRYGSNWIRMHVLGQGQQRRLRTAAGRRTPVRKASPAPAQPATRQTVHVQPAPVQPATTKRRPVVRELDRALAILGRQNKVALRI